MKFPSTIGTLTVCLCFVFALGSAAGQSSRPPAQAAEAAQEPATRALADYLLARLRTEGLALRPTTDPERKKDSDAPGKLAQAYQDVVRQPSAFADRLGGIAEDYFRARSFARSAPQANQAAAEAQLEIDLLRAAQAQVLVEQNREIIGLLKQIAAKK